MAKGKTSLTKDLMPSIHNAVVNEMGDSVVYGMESAGVPTEALSNMQLREQGSYFMDNGLGELYINTLARRIAFELIKNRLAQNPLSVFKRGTFELGETIEEIFVEMAKPHVFNASVAEREVFKREIPKVLTKFHKLNYKTFYKHTVQETALRRNFLSFNALEKMTSAMVTSMYSGANYDEYLCMMYLVGRNVLDGNIHIENVGNLTGNGDAIVTRIKEISDDFTIADDSYTEAKVMQVAETERQFLVQSNKFKNTTDVEVLAKAFNLSKVEFLPRTVAFNSFGKMKWERLNELLVDFTNFKPFTEAEITKLEGIHALLISEDWFMIYDYDISFNEIFNPEGKYWNYFLHVERLNSTSPFENAVAFTNFDVAPITAITLASDVTAVNVGALVPIKITTTPADIHEYDFVISNNTSTGTYMNGDVLVIGGNETSTSITVKAVYNSVESNVLTFTVS